MAGRAVATRRVLIAPAWCVAAVIAWTLATTCVVPVQAAERLVPYRVVGDGIPVPLTDRPGDPRSGRVLAANSSHGNCLICHAMPIPEAPVFGDLGPPLDGIGRRLTEAQLRLRVVNAKKLNPRSVMPAYYKVDGLWRVAPKYQGQPMLSAQEVEDIVAYMLTLR